MNEKTKEVIEALCDTYEARLTGVIVGNNETAEQLLEKLIGELRQEVKNGNG